MNQPEIDLVWHIAELLFWAVVIVAMLKNWGENK